MGEAIKNTWLISALAKSGLSFLLPAFSQLGRDDLPATAVDELPDSLTLRLQPKSSASLSGSGNAKIGHELGCLRS
jgi:hypothetical protein